MKTQGLFSKTMLGFGFLFLYVPIVSMVIYSFNDSRLVTVWNSVPALMEMLGDGRRTWPHLPKVYDFKNGKLWPNERPGLGVEVDVSKLMKIGEYATYRAGMLLNHRPDGSFTNW